MNINSRYSGVIFGACYGIVIRMFVGISAFGNFYNIYSISFIWITPIIISVIPVFISSNELYKSKINSFFFPIMAVMVFGLVALLTGLEDFLCLLILGLPFLIASGLVGLIIGAIIKGRKINKKLYSIVLIPLFFNPIENLFPNQSDRYVVENKITIHENAATVWNNIIEVPEISEEEYSYGFLNYAGVPRPIKSALEMKDGIEYRVGYFSENIKLYETISEREENRFVNFKMHMDKSQLRNKPTDQHLLKSKNFNFENISYQLIATGLNITELTLRCEYEIESKMNGYANFWAEMIINDFEVRLLETLKLKIEK